MVGTVEDLKSIITKPRKHFDKQCLSPPACSSFLLILLQNWTVTFLCCNTEVTYFVAMLVLHF